MKIVHFLKGRCNPDSANGVEKTIFHLAQHQAKLGHAVHILGLSEKKVIPIEGVQVHHCSPTAWLFTLPPDVWTSLKTMDPDVVHFHSMYVLPNILLARHLHEFGIPYVVTPHGGCSSHILRRRSFLKFPYKLLLERPYLNKAVFVHSVGDTQQIRDYGALSPIVIAPNGIDRSSIPSSRTSNPILAARPTWKSRTIFSFVGRLDLRQKGLDLMLKGLAQAVDVNSALGLVIVGPDSRGNQKQLQQLTKSLNLTDHVYFAGPAYGQTKFDFILSSDFFIHTSRWEGLPFSVIEALACGLPCVVSEPANPCGLISKYAAGWEIDLTSASISDTLLEAARIPASKRINMRQEAFHLVDNNLQWPEIAKRTTDAYQHYLEQSQWNKRGT